MNRLAISFLVAAVLWALPTKGQYYQSINYKEGSGLPSSESYLVFQDSKGFIWIGTDNGVVKFDGHEFVTYNNTHGLTDNTVFGFQEDNAGRIWFRTYNGLLSYYQNDTIKPYRFNSTLKSLINASIIVTMYPDSTDDLYFSTTLHAMASHIDSAGHVAQITRPNDEWNFIRFLDGKMLLGSSGIPKNIHYVRINDQKYEIALDDPDRQSNSLIACVKWRDRYYFSLHKNLFVYDGRSVKKVFTSQTPFICLYVDHEDRLWAGYFNNGVQIFDDTSFQDPRTLSTLEELSVSSVLEDNEGGIWTSTLDQGVFYFPNLAVQNFEPPNNTRVSAIASTGTHLLLGSYDGEVFRMEPSGKFTKVHEGVAPISNLFTRGDSTWVSDASGTYILPGLKRVEGRNILSSGFRGLTTVGRFVYGYNSTGVFRISTAGELLEKLEARKRPTAMAIAGNEIFLGALHGVEVFDIELSRPSIKITESRVASLANFGSEFVLIGTTGQGLHAFDRNTRKLADIPLPGVRNVYSIYCEEKSRVAWLGTEKGLYQLTFLRDTTALVLSSYARATGLIATKITYVTKLGTSIWAVSDLGISSVPPSQFITNQPSPIFYVSRIMVKNQLLKGNPRSIQTDDGNMVIDVRTISFKDFPTSFRYRLSTESPWLPVEGGSILLGALDPGLHNLEIQAAASNGEWTQNLVLPIHVAAAWWETWYFRVSLVISLILLGVGVYRIRINSIRRRQNYLELINLHQQKLIDSEIRTQERERKRIATDLHDGIGASLSSIKILVSDAINSPAPDREVRGKEINENLADVIEDIKRIVYDLHPPGLERYGLQAGLKSLVDRLNKIGDINVFFDYYGQRDVPQSIAITVFRIIQELINNTLKHARATEIRIHVNQFDDEMNIMYEDNGIGMIGSRFTGLGLHSIESRVRSLNGRMTWESNHKGTFYNFDIPF